jgi:hypothetical protein
MSNRLPKVEAFREQLQQLGADFLCHTHLPDSRACISFLGTFQGQIVLWKMNLSTLVYLNSNTSQNTLAEISDTHTRPFIEIKEGSEGVFDLGVGLDLEVINEAVIKKTIIMIRNYKRLDIGLIEFGSMHA